MGREKPPADVWNEASRERSKPAFVSVAERPRDGCRVASAHGKKGRKRVCVAARRLTPPISSPNAMFMAGFKSHAALSRLGGRTTHYGNAPCCIGPARRGASCIAVVLPAPCTHPWFSNAAAAQKPSDHWPLRISVSRSRILPLLGGEGRGEGGLVAPKRGVGGRRLCPPGLNLIQSMK